MASCSTVSVTALTCTITSNFNTHFFSCTFSNFGSLCYNYCSSIDPEGMSWPGWSTDTDSKKEYPRNSGWCSIR